VKRNKGAERNKGTTVAKITFQVELEGNTVCDFPDEKEIEDMENAVHEWWGKQVEKVTVKVIARETD
jgi:hypothetical protein